LGLQGVKLGPDAHILDGMKSADFSQRTKAFDEASALLASGKLAPDASDSVKVGIIQLLMQRTPELTSQMVRPRSKQQPPARCRNDTDDCEGDESDYNPNLIATVAAFNDERAIPALAGACPTPESLLKHY
jgi:hypothetical protein